MLTKTELNQILDANPEFIRITVDDDGQVIARTYEPRGDGGPVPWDKFLGTMEDVRHWYLS